MLLYINIIFIWFLFAKRYLMDCMRELFYHHMMWTLDYKSNPSHSLTPNEVALTVI